MANDKDFRIKNGLQLGGSLVEAVGTITGTTLDLTSGNVFSYTPTAETTFVFSNPPATGTALGFTLELNGEFIDGGYDLANAEPPVYGRFSVAAQETTPTGIFFKPDGTKMYVIGYTGDAVWQYSTGSVGDVTFTYPASVEWPAGTPPTAPADGETDLLTFLTQDGGTTYYGRVVGDDFS